jgi:serine/threonine protein kinase
MNPTHDRTETPLPLAALPPEEKGGEEGDDDPRLLDAAKEYLAEIEGGRRPERDAFVARFPDLAGRLAPYLDALDLFQAAAPAAPAKPAAEDVPPAESLGDYRIIREIGRGGMGVVYEAVQRSLGRKVALKVLPFAAALDAKQLRRFKNEAQAAAHLHHTNIVPVYAVGSERGVHYYAMQLIEGRNLAALIADLRRQAAPAGAVAALPRSPESTPTGPYPPGPAPAADTRPETAAKASTLRSLRPAEFFRTAARLAAQAAEALEHAHQLGVVHRDVKPANLLIDDGGHVWITDFGLAQFHADAGLTQTGDLVGTLRYMSPEQAEGRRVVLDHRTDIYSLGATLYELLTLRPIFEGEDRKTLLCQIMCDEPRPPRAIDRSIPPELETIVLKAVAKAPADRYASARDLADDLNRFLRHEPIQARRPTLVQRTRKWLVRHPSVSVTAVLLLVLLTAGSLVAALLIRAEQEKTLRRAQEAEDHLRLAKRSVDEMIQVAEVDLADKPGMESVRKQMLESALVYYQEFIALRKDDPESRAELAATQEHVQKILDDLAVLQGSGQLMLVYNPDVQKDLGLSQAQHDRLDKLWHDQDEQRKKSFAEFRGLSAEERKQRFLDQARAAEAGVREILTEEQFRRLGQIGLQLQGLSAFRDPLVANALHLTAEQKVRLRAAEAEVFFGGPAPGGPGGPGKRPPNQEWRPPTDKIQAILTEEQMRQWKDKTGEPYKGPPPFFGMFGPPPGGPRPGGPPGDRSDRDRPRPQ